MPNHRYCLPLAAILLTLVTSPCRADVTLIGNVINNAHTGEKEKCVVLNAFDGTPEVKAAFEKILAEDYPEKGLDADAAVKFQDRFSEKLKYYVAGAELDKLHKEVLWGSKIMALTGVVEQKQGRNWITVSRSEPASFKYPAKLLAPDKPFVMPDKEPLILKISDSLSLTCVYIPAGKFFMGAPYYQSPRWQEDPPHVVTLTRPFYIGEVPVAQDIYEAVMGANPATVKGDKLPVNGIYCREMNTFCQKLSEKTGRKVRLPTAAEWEYAARAGTSNPTFAEKHAKQNSGATAGYSSPALPVKSKEPNAWGLYDLCGGSWELVSDGTGQIDRAAATDPRHIPPADKPDGDKNQRHDHMGKGNQNYPISEIEFLHPGDGKMLRFRVVVEAEPEKK